MSLSYRLNEFDFTYEKEPYLFSDVSCEFQLEEISIITGKNGTGKTTFCRLISGLIPSYRGTLELIDRNLKTLSNEELMDKIIFIKQDLTGSLIGVTPDEDLQIWQNRFRDNDTPAKKELREKALSAMGLLSFKDEPLWKLSFGQKRRVMLAALSLFPHKYWIVDEPTAGLDDAGIKLFLELLLEKKKSGVGGIITTHRMDLLSAKTDRHFELTSGKLVEQL